MTDIADTPTGIERQQQQSLSTTAARKLATTTKSVPQMQAISSRWLLKALPWVDVSGGVYRVNRRLSYAVGDGRLTFLQEGQNVRVVPEELRELPVLRGFDDEDVLAELAGRFTRQDYQPGDVIVEFGHEPGHVFLVVHGKVSKTGAGEYGGETSLGVLADGDYFAEKVLTEDQVISEFTAKAVTSCTVLALARESFTEIADRSAELSEYLARLASGNNRPQAETGEAAIDLASGHAGEPTLPGTFVDYDESPREYELSVAQTVLRVHSRVADLYSEPMNQVEQQLRLTIEALRERQEHEMVNNREIGLLHNADFGQRTHTRTGPPTPDDFDDLLAMVWKDPGFFLAHPRTIAAFGHECNARGIYPASVEVDGHHMPGWRGIPILPCNKIPVSETRTSSVLLMRTGEQDQGVVALRQTNIPDEYEPSLSVKFMGLSEKAIISYLVSAYYSIAVLVPDALAVLDSVELGRESS